jgi:carbamoyl-phosphate synthase large subunit
VHYAVYVLEVNPRASRTSPFVSKATGLPLPKMAAKCMVGVTLAEQGITEEVWPEHTSVKESVFPFARFAGVDIILGPEMRSTGEVMGHAAHFGYAFAKSQLAVGSPLPTEGAVLITVNDYDKSAALKLGRDFNRMGFELYATAGTAAALKRVNLPVTAVPKAGESGQTTVDLIKSGKVHLIINTPLGERAYEDQAAMRRAAIQFKVPLISTLTAAQAAVNGIHALRERVLTVRSLQHHYNQQKN